jgi:hypothetical protein
MASIYNDDQRQSLINSMTNPESNATKFVEQGEDIGLPRDVTMDILNRYATYGANTGIGNLGGERLVNALNDEYRKRVDEPLQSNPPEMLYGGFTAIADILANLGSSAIQGIGNVGSSIADVFTSGGAEAASGAADASATAIEAVNSPVTISSEGTRTAGEGLGEVTLDVAAPDLASVDPSPDPTRLEKFQKYLDENPLVAKQLMASGQDIGKVLGQALGGGGKRESRVPVRAPRPRFQPGAIRSQRIGMEDGGSVLGRKLFLEGGEVDGPGGPKEDLVPIWASDKEYVVSHQGVKNMGGGDFDKGIAALDKVNFGK